MIQRKGRVASQGLPQGMRHGGGRDEPAIDGRSDPREVVQLSVEQGFRAGAAIVKVVWFHRCGVFVKFSSM
jgi:hypothetical protein